MSLQGQALKDIKFENVRVDKITSIYGSYTNIIQIL